MRGIYKLESAFDFFSSYYRLTVLSEKAWSPRIVPNKFPSERDAEAWVCEHLPSYVRETIPYFNALVNNLRRLPRPSLNHQE